MDEELMISSWMYECHFRKRHTRCGSLLQEEASQEEDQSHRLDWRVFRCAQGKFSGVEADPCRAGAALALGAVTAVDRIAFGVLYNNLVVVHVILFCFRVDV